jgi:hypothetical protein
LNEPKIIDFIKFHYLSFVEKKTTFTRLIIFAFQSHLNVLKNHDDLVLTSMRRITPNFLKNFLNWLLKKKFSFLFIIESE